MRSQALNLFFRDDNSSENKIPVIGLAALIDVDVGHLMHGPSPENQRRATPVIPRGCMSLTTGDLTH